jgi:hypothetical protein
MSEPKPRCGTQMELVRSRAARVSRCACGAIHLHLPNGSMTLHFERGGFDELVRALNTASRKLAGDSGDGGERRAAGPRDPNVN